MNNNLTISNSATIDIEADNNSSGTLQFDIVAPGKGAKGGIVAAATSAPKIYNYGLMSFRNSNRTTQYVRIEAAVNNDSNGALGVGTISIWQTAQVRFDGASHTGFQYDVNNQNNATLFLSGDVSFLTGIGQNTGATFGVFQNRTITTPNFDLLGGEFNDPLGRITLSGNLTVGAATIKLSLSGSPPSDWSVLTVTGTLTLANNASIFDLDTNNVMPPGTFGADMIVATTRNGTFNVINAPLGGWAAVYNGANLRITG